jgi:hypothetical protein
VRLHRLEFTVRAPVHLARRFDERRARRCRFLVSSKRRTISFQHRLFHVSAKVVEEGDHSERHVRLGFFDKDEDRVEPGPNPSAQKVLPMSPARRDQVLPMSREGHRNRPPRVVQAGKPFRLKRTKPARSRIGPSLFRGRCQPRQVGRRILKPPVSDSSNQLPMRLLFPGGIVCKVSAD